MERSNILLVSVGLGFIIIAFLDVTIPIPISLGLTVFVAMLTLHDWSVGITKRWFAEANLSKEKYFKSANVIDKTMILVSDYYLYIAAPLAIITPYLALKYGQSLEEMMQSQQSLTLASLALVIFIISRDKN